MPNILCASDLTPASTKALVYATRIAARIKSDVKVLHVLEAKDASGLAEAIEALDLQIQKVGGGINVSPLLLNGDPLEMIAQASAQGHKLLVLGTHGARGLRQKLFGSDILKLVRRVSIPCLVVQENSSVQEDQGPIVFPVTAHEHVGLLIDTVIALALSNDAAVHVFQVDRPGERLSDELVANKELMLSKIQQAGVPVQEVHQAGTLPSLGFASTTLEYAQRVKAGCIAIMRHASEEYRYIADAEKERLIANELYIPILCG